MSGSAESASDNAPQDPAVDWSQLPQHPVRFFDLQNDFDSRQLKRAYNRLIRTYKPERNPAEFQRIRAAYEQLDNQLRYGNSVSDTVSMIGISASELWNTHTRQPVSQSRIGPVDLGMPSDWTAEWLQRARTTDPQLLFQELKRQPEKTPLAYYLLALLSDALPGKSETRFATCLLSGLRAHPGDPGLSALLYTFYRRPMSPEAADSLLRDTARILRNDRFFSLTEPLWDVLIQHRDFSDVLELLSDCEAQLRDLRIAAKFAFLLHILRIGVWKADAAWIQSTIELLESSRQLSPYAESELELLTLAWEYRRHSDQPAAGGNLRSRMHAALVSYFTLPEAERDTAIVECQIQIASSVDEIQAAFPDSAAAELDPIVSLWLAVGNEVAYRQLGDRPRFRELDKSVQRRVQSYLLTMEAMSQRSLSGRLWCFLAIFFELRFITVLIVAGIAWLIASVLPLVGVGGVFSALIGVAAAGAAFFPCDASIVQPAWEWYGGRIENRLYRNQWRGSLLQFLANSRLHPRDFLNTAIELREPEMQFSGCLLELMTSDPATYIYTMAQVYLS